MPQCFAVAVGQRLARGQGRARRRLGRVISLGANAIGDRIRRGRGRAHRTAVARCPRRRHGLACCRRCAPPLAGPQRGSRPARSTSCSRCPATCAGWPRARSSSTTRLAAGEAVIITNPDDPGAAVGLVPEFSYDESRRGGRDRARIVCAVLDGVLATAVHRRSSITNWATPSTSCARRYARRPMRSAPSVWDRRPPTSPTRADWSSNCWNPHGNTGFPTTRRRARCACWRTPRTSTRSSRSVPGLSRMPGPAGPQSSSEARIANDALRPLGAVVRSARMAAVNTILNSAWSD